MAKKVSEVPVEINELALSLLGWEVQDFRARVTTEQFKRDGECFHKLAVSGVFRFNDADWADCFSYSREYPTHPVMLLSSPAISDRPAIFSPYLEDPTKGRPVRVAEDGYFINTYRPIDHDDLRIELTGYDSVGVDDDITDIPLQMKKIPVELVDESAPSSVCLTFDQFEAFTHRGDDQGKTNLGQIRAAGRVTFGTTDELLADWDSASRRKGRGLSPYATVARKAPFLRGTPWLFFDILDDTGFLLGQHRAEKSLCIHVDERGQVPSRTPRWLVDLAFDPDDYSAPPSRVVARLVD